MYKFGQSLRVQRAVFFFSYFCICLWLVRWGGCVGLWQGKWSGWKVQPQLQHSRSVGAVSPLRLSCVAACTPTLTTTWKRLWGRRATSGGWWRPRMPPLTQSRWTLPLGTDPLSQLVLVYAAFSGFIMRPSIFGNTIVNIRQCPEGGCLSTMFIYVCDINWSSVRESNKLTSTYVCLHWYIHTSQPEINFQSTIFIYYKTAMIWLVIDLEMLNVDCFEIPF